MDAGFGAKIHHPVGAADGVLVVFHHDHGVAQVPQLEQHLDQLVVVALMQADAGFVQNVHHPHQLAADLAGQADALALAAGEGGRTPVQIEIVQAHAGQEAQPVFDLFEDLLGDQQLIAAELEPVEKVNGLPHAEFGNRADVHLPHPHGQGTGF